MIGGEVGHIRGFRSMNGFGSRTMQGPQLPFGPVPLNGSLSNNLLCILYENNPYAHSKQLILNSVVDDESNVQEGCAFAATRF